MRRLLTFAVQGETLGASLDAGDGGLGLVMVTGGTQTRVGSHRMYERLAAALSGLGVTTLRFDRRGVGDSSGGDPGFRQSGEELAAAVELLRRERPGLRKIYGFGLCDGATALCLAGAQAGLDGVILANPWLVEAEAGSPAPAAVRHHYRERLLSREGWKKILTGQINIRKLLKGLRSVAGAGQASPLAQQAASGLSRSHLPAVAILCSGDATAIAARNELKALYFNGLIAEVHMIDSDSHTFARPGDAEHLAQAMSAALAKLGA
jgi:exosortase A-associated hydrolase 1